MTEQTQKCIFALNSKECVHGKCGCEHGSPAPEQLTIDPRLLEPIDPIKLMEEIGPKRGFFSQVVKPKYYPRRRKKSSAPSSAVAGGRPGTRLRRATRVDEVEGEADLGPGDETEVEDWS